MELRLFLGAIRRNLLLLLVLTLLGVVGGVGLALEPAAKYSATASVSVAQPNLSAISGTNNQLDPATYVATQVGVIDGTSILNAAAAKANTSADALEKRLSVGQRQSSDIIDITATASSPDEASSLANVVASTYLTQLGTTVNGVITAAEQSQQQRINALNSQIATAGSTEATALLAEVSQLEGQLSSVETAAAGALANNKIVNIADLPTSPQPRHTAIKAALGLIIGLALGAVIAVLVAAARPRMIRARDVEQALGITPAAELPHIADWRHELPGTVNRDPGREWKEHPAFADEVTKIAVFVEAARSVRNCKTVLVASLEPNAGVSTVTAALAAILREGSRTVRLVSVAERGDNRADAEQSVGVYGDGVIAAGESPWTGMTFSRMGRASGARSADSFRRRDEHASLVSDDDFDADILVMDGGNMTETASVVAIARASDVTVLIVPLPAANERYLHTLTRAIFSDAKGQLLIATNHLSAPRMRRS